MAIIHSPCGAAQSWDPLCSRRRTFHLPRDSRPPPGSGSVDPNFATLGIHRESVSKIDLPIYEMCYIFAELLLLSVVLCRRQRAGCRHAVPRQPLSWRVGHLETGRPVPLARVRLMLPATRGTSTVSARDHRSGQHAVLLTPRPMARWVFPMPGGPNRMTFPTLATKVPVMRWARTSRRRPGRQPRLKSSRVLTVGK